MKSYFGVVIMYVRGFFFFLENWRDYMIRDVEGQFGNVVDVLDILYQMEFQVYFLMVVMIVQFCSLVLQFSIFFLNICMQVVSLFIWFYQLKYCFQGF